MSKGKLKNQKRAKKAKTGQQSSQQKSAGKKVTKKKIVKKKILKKSSGKQKAIKKTPVKKSVSGKTQKASVKQTKRLKSSSKKHKADKPKKHLKTKSQISKKSSAKVQNLAAGTKSRSFVPSLNYREKELRKLLEREKEEKLVLKDMEGRTYCAVENCDYPALVEGFCRIHFFGLFKVIKKKKHILEQDLLTKSYLSLVNKYSESVFDYLFKDLSSDKDFHLAVKKFTDEGTDDLENEEIFSD